MTISTPQSPSFMVGRMSSNALGEIRMQQVLVEETNGC